jgi:hypothetical protein
MLPKAQSHTYPQYYPNNILNKANARYTVSKEKMQKAGNIKETTSTPPKRPNTH